MESYMGLLINNVSDFILKYYVVYFILCIIPLIIVGKKYPLSNNKSDLDAINKTAYKWIIISGIPIGSLSGIILMSIFNYKNVGFRLMILLVSSVFFGFMHAFYFLLGKHAKLQNLK